MIKLFKKDSTYTDRNTGEPRKATRFYLGLGNAVIPIEVSYFGKEDKPDTQYSGRKLLLTAFADELPEKEKTEPKPVKESAQNDASADDLPF